MYYIDIFFFILSSITVLYLLAFSFFSMIERKDKFHNKIKNRFSIIIPTYKDDEYIIKAVESLKNQDYPIDCYDIYVVCDHVKDETISLLKGDNVNLIIVDFINGSKTKSLKYAANVIDKSKYDIALILNSDNISDSDLLSKINDTFSLDFNAVQCHRIHKERTSKVSIIDAVSDEINNSIFRRGHVSIGLSCSLCGAGMAFDYSWFAENIIKLTDYQDEKAIESLLLKDNIFIDYLNDANIYALKSDNRKKFYKQRKNWIYSHYNSFFKNVHNLPSAFFRGNFDYVDRIIQWGIFPRSILIFVIITFAVFYSYFNWTESLKWWGLLLIFLFSMAFSIPDYLVDKKFNKAFQALPFIGIGLFFKLIFRTK